MGLWLHLHLGPVGLTARGRRKPQSHRAYKASRERRTQHAERYQAELAAKKTRRAAAAAASADTDVRDPRYDAVETSDLIRLLSMWREQGTAMHRSKSGPAHIELAASEAAKLEAAIHARGITVPAGLARDLRGITSADFDGYSVPTLRASVRYHQDVANRKRVPFDNVDCALADPTRLSAEIEARGWSLTRASHTTR